MDKFFPSPRDCQLEDTSRLGERELTCYKFTAVQVVRVADVVVAEAPDAVVVEGLEAATDATVVLETAVRGLHHLPPTTTTGNLGPVWSNPVVPGQISSDIPMLLTP